MLGMCFKSLLLLNKTEESAFEKRHNEDVKYAAEKLYYFCFLLTLSPSLLQSEGSLLATGSYDGFARIWTKDGDAQSFFYITASLSDPSDFVLSCVP